MENLEQIKEVDQTKKSIRFNVWDWILLIGAIIILPWAVIALSTDGLSLLLSSSGEQLGRFIADIVWLAIAGWVLKLKLEKFKEAKTAKAHKFLIIAIWIVATLIIIVIFSFFLVFKGERTARDARNDIGTSTTSIQSEQANIPGFVRYAGQEAGFNFNVLFPTPQPESFYLDLKEVYIKSYQAVDPVDINREQFVQYSVFFSTPSAGRILSDESIRAYLKRYPEGKSASSGGTLIREEMTTYKGLTATEYIFNSEIQGIATIHKGVAFIVDGIPIDLSVVHSVATPESQIYYDEYLGSFGVSQN